MPFALRGHRQGVGGEPGLWIARGAVEAAAALHQLHHRLDQGWHITLEEELRAGGHGPCQGLQEGRLQHPSLVVACLEPGIGELEAHQRKPARGELGEPCRQADAGMGEEKAQVGNLGLLAVGLGGAHQGAADLQAEVIAVRAQGSQGQQKASPGTADVEVERQEGIGEEIGQGRQRPWQLIEAAEGVDVLTHHQPLGTRKAQQAV